MPNILMLVTVTVMLAGCARNPMLDRIDADLSADSDITVVGSKED